VAKKKWFEAGEEEHKGLIPSDVKIVSDGTGRVWVREQPTGAREPEDAQFYEAYLDFRGHRQALPRGSSPLMAFEGRIICGQEFTREEVEAYIIVYGLDPKKVCVFEYVRESSDAHRPARSLVIAAEEVLAKLEDQFGCQRFLSYPNHVFPRPTGVFKQLLERLEELAKERSIPGSCWGVSQRIRSLEGSRNYTVLAETTVGIAPKAVHITVAQARQGFYTVVILWRHLETALLD